MSITDNKEWCTPPKYVEAVKTFFDGTIELDPCSNDYSIVNAEVEYKLPYQDGLTASWNFKKIFVNPPYGNNKINGTHIRDWFEKCCNAFETYGSEVLALVPVAPNTLYWKKYVYYKSAAICFLYDTRLKFLINGTCDNKGAPMSCCIIYWGKNIEKFKETFQTFGAVMITI